MLITKMTGSIEPQQIRYKIKLGLRQYTIAFDIHKSETEDQGQYQWTEATFDLGQPSYSQLVAAIIQSRYPSDDMQAIINNHLMDDGNSEHETEWKKMQAWRAESKNMAKSILAQLKV